MGIQQASVQWSQGPETTPGRCLGLKAVKVRRGKGCVCGRPSYKGLITTVPG